jgi:hypothetical protein
MNDSGSFTHRPRAKDPQAFRAQATGIGQARKASLMTGAARAQRVVDAMPPEQRAAVPAAEGYPAPMSDYVSTTGMLDADMAAMYPPLRPLRLPTPISK